MADERWLPVVGWEAYYEVSDLGRVRRLARVVRCLSPQGQMGKRAYGEIMMRPAPTAKRGTGSVTLSVGSRRLQRYVADLVWEAFVGIKPPGTELRRLNDDPADDRLANLVCASRSENAAQKKKAGQIEKRIGRDHPNAKLTEEQVQWLRLTAGSVDTREAAARLRVSEWAVQQARKGKTWKHVELSADVLDAPR